MCMSALEHRLRARELDHSIHFAVTDAQRQPGWLIRLLGRVWMRQKPPEAAPIGIPAE